MIWKKILSCLLSWNTIGCLTCLSTYINKTDFSLRLIMGLLCFILAELKKGNDS